MNLFRGALFTAITILLVHSAASSQDATGTASEYARLIRLEERKGLRSENLPVSKRLIKLECLVFGSARVGSLSDRLSALEQGSINPGNGPEQKTQGLSSRQMATAGSDTMGASGMSKRFGISTASTSLNAPFGEGARSASVPRSPSASSPYTKQDMAPVSPYRRRQGTSGYSQGLSATNSIMRKNEMALLSPRTQVEGQTATGKSRGVSPLPPRMKSHGVSSTRASGISTSSPLVRPDAMDAIAGASPGNGGGIVGVNNYQWPRNESRQYFKDGASITVDKNSSTVVYDCMHGTAIINASNCDLTFRGSYKQITVRGNNNKVVLHNASAVALNGNANTIYWSAENAPKIADTGNKNSITRRRSQ